MYASEQILLGFDISDYWKAMGHRNAPWFTRKMKLSVDVSV